MANKDQWIIEITPKKSPLEFNFKEIWRYRDLLFLFVKRDIITLYKQTILGPLWYLIQPLFTSVIFTLIFNNVAGIETGKVPPFLFNLAGITAWGYFKNCLMNTSDTFKKNEAIFGKVYFPRVIVPLSIVISNLVRFGIQLLIFVSFYVYFISTGEMQLSLNYTLIYIPFIVITMGLTGLGLGNIISSLVTKYRDLTYLLSFGIQLLMYLSAVMYPIHVIKEKVPKISWIIEYNPIATIIETFRNISFGDSNISIIRILIVLMISFIIFLLGLLVFNRTEKNFIDTV